MKSSVRFNTRLLTTSIFDSGALGLLVHLVHRFPQAGTYQAAVYRDEQRVGTTCFRVTEQAGATQINIDLASVGSPVGEAKCACREHPESAPAVSPNGYVLFHAPRGIGTYAVVVGEREGAEPLFDNRSLTDGDLFALALIEPATYRLESLGGSATGELHVAPIPPGTNLRTAAPVTIDVTKDAFQPSQVNVHAGQGIVFRARGAKRIVITKGEILQRTGAAATAAPGARRTRRHVRVWRRGALRKDPQS